MVTLEQSLERLATAETRNQIGDAIIDYCDGRLGAAALLIVRGKSAIGWRGLSADGSRQLPSFDKVALSLGGSSVLQVALDTERTFCGPSPAAGRPIERTLSEVLGVGDPPTEMLVVPIAVGKRIVNLLYGHAEGGRAISEVHRLELGELATACSAAYTRLIQATRIDRLVR